MTPEVAVPAHIRQRDAVIGGLVEITEEGRHLSLFRGFLKVSADGKEIGRVPLDDINTLLVSARATSLSTNLMAELAERKAMIVTLGQNWHPKTLTLPLDAHYQSAGILQEQIALSAARRKRLWQQVVTEKITNQAKILKWHTGNKDKIGTLERLASRVRSGDPDNLEAQAARHYWPALMGADFRRDTAGTHINGYLNYGYAILRAATARALVSAGLTPALGIHHRNKYNSFALVDDLMEPYRPLVDHLVRKLKDQNARPLAQKPSAGTDISDSLPPLGPEEKRLLARILQYDLPSEKGLSPVVNCLHVAAQSFVACLNDKSLKLTLARVPESLPGQQDLFQ